MGEFPLILFTVLSQLAAGAAITLVFLDYFTDRIDDAAGKKCTLAVLIVTGASLGISLLHVGHPLNIYRALTHLGSSWLSREAFLFTLLAAALLVYYFQWKENNPFRKTLGLVTAAVALLAVVTSGMVYVLPAVPAWNNFSPIIFFLMTGAVLGPLFILALLKKQDGLPFTRLVQFVGIILAASFMCFLVYLSVLLSSGGPSALTGMNIMGDSTLWLRFVLNWILPLGLLAWLGLRKERFENKYLIGLFSLVFVGEILGRYLFYYTAVALQVSGL